MIMRKRMLWPTLLVVRNITVNIITKIPCTLSGHYNIWVNIGRSTKSFHLISARKDYHIDTLLCTYIDIMIRCHDVSLDITFDCDNHLIRHFWQTLQSTLRARSKISTTYYPQKNGQTKGSIQTLEDITSYNKCTNKTSFET